MRKLSIALTTLTALIGFSSIGHAGTITYAIQNYPADQDGANLTGFITTDGTIGDLAASDILSWSWTVTPFTGPSNTTSSTDPYTNISLTGSVIASPTEITIGAGLNELQLYSNYPYEGTDLRYTRYLNDNVYTANHNVNENYWYTNTIGGTDPWVIASTVPEPSSIVLMGFAAGCGLFLRSTRKHERRLK